MSLNIRTHLNTPFHVGKLLLPNRLIQGPLAGYSCAPLRQLFYQFIPPAYCVSEMISAQTLQQRTNTPKRYIYRAPEEQRLCYQISGANPDHLVHAASYLESLGADLIDINCGCPKPKIRKKGAGSALLDNPLHLIKLIEQVRGAIQIPLTIKIRLQDTISDVDLAQRIEQAGADALIVHARRWTEDYNVACDWTRIAAIKRAVSIPVIANGDLTSCDQIAHVYQETGCDAFMLARAGCGQPWLYDSLLTGVPSHQLITLQKLTSLFKQHVYALAALESERQAILQSQSLIRYYFKQSLSCEQLEQFRKIQHVNQLDDFLMINFYK